jgi:hypothetical protein
MVAASASGWLALKGDEFTVSLCRVHHQNLHQHGNENAWWANLQSHVPVQQDVCECVGQPQLHLCRMHLACAKARAARLALRRRNSDRWLCAGGIRIAGPPLLL